MFWTYPNYVKVRWSSNESIIFERTGLLTAETLKFRRQEAFDPCYIKAGDTKNIQVLEFISNTKHILSSYIWYQMYYSNIEITINSLVWRIALKKVQIQNTPYKDG